MRCWRYIVLAGILSLLVSCHPEPVPEPEGFPGMVLIKASGRFFAMGSTDTWAAGDEKPPMRVGFSYDFFMDTNEVTLAEYWQTMRVLPEKYAMSDTEKTLPVANVTWYDALLFCNARSLNEHLDTVYSYSSVERTDSGKVYRINDLHCDLKKRGYRLPTEAEWEFASRGGSATVFPWGSEPDAASAAKIAWYSDNAAGTVHEVGVLDRNPYRLHDMFGNVAEWVNDWKGVYAVDTLVNYIGPADNGFDEHPVKGGCFNQAVDKLRPPCRSDSYDVLSSTATKYIGLRCCIGAVEPFTRGGGSSGVDSANPVYLTTRSDLSWLPTRNARIVFVNATGQNRLLCFVDLYEANPRIYQYGDITETANPTISPDGKWVAFGTRDEGVRSGSSVYVRRLDKDGSRLTRLAADNAFIPRWWVDGATNDTFIVYTTSAILDDEDSWHSTSTMMQKISDGTPVGEPQVLTDDGSFHGGLSADKHYCATGYRHLRMEDLVSHEVKTLFTAPQNGKPQPDTSQVCNVSIGPDSAHADQVMFLDFGSGPTTSTVVGSTYGVHEVLFIGDYSGAVRAWYRCPPSLGAWDHTEWSNHPDFAIATAGEGKGIYAIHLADSSVHECIGGTLLRHPYLWISSDSSLQTSAFDSDSAGWYNEPENGMYQKNYAAKLPYFLNRADSIEILGLGSSRMQNGWYPQLITNYKGFNMAYAAGGLKGIKYILDNYALQHCSRLKMVAFSLDICWFDREAGDYAWDEGIARTKGSVYDRNHDFWKTGFPQGFLPYLLTVPLTTNEAYAVIMTLDGWYPCSVNGWGAENPEVQDRWKWKVNQNVMDNIALVESMAKDLADRGIQMVGILFPQSPHFRSTAVYGFEGPETETAAYIISQLNDIAGRNSRFHVYDAHRMGEHDYDDNDAFDNCHLSDPGARKFTERFRGFVDSVLVK